MSALYACPRRPSERPTATEEAREMQVLKVYLAEVILARRVPLHVGTKDFRKITFGDKIWPYILCGLCKCLFSLNVMDAPMRYSH